MEKHSQLDKSELVNVFLFENEKFLKIIIFLKNKNMQHTITNQALQMIFKRQEHYFAR